MYEIILLIFRLSVISIGRPYLDKQHCNLFLIYKLSVSNNIPSATQNPCFLPVSFSIA